MAIANRTHMGPAFWLHGGSTSSFGVSHAAGPNASEGPPTEEDYRQNQWIVRFANGGTANTVFSFQQSPAGSGSLVNLVTSWRRIWFRFDVQFPTSDDVAFFAFGNDSTNKVVLTVNIDGTLKCRNLGSQVAYPGELVATLGTAQLHKWHVVDAIVVGKSAGPAGGGSVSLNFDNAIIVTNWASSITTGQGQGVGFWNGSTGMRVNSDVIGRPSGTSSGSVGLFVDYANWVGADDTSELSTAGRIFTLRPVGAGTYNQFSGNLDYREHNRGLDRGGAVATSTSSGLKQTWLLQNMNDVGIASGGAGRVIKSAVIHMYLPTQPFSDRPSALIRRNGVDTTIVCNYAASSGWMSTKVDTTGWSNTDTIEIGIVSTGTQQIDVANVCLTIEADYSDFLETGSNTDYHAMEVSWTGSGVPQFVTLPEADPDFIYWWPRGNNTLGGLWCRRWAGGHLFNTGGNTLDDLRVSDDGIGLDIIGSRAGGPNVSTVVYDALVIYDQVGRIVLQGKYHDVNTAGRDDRNIPFKFARKIVAGVFTDGEDATPDFMWAVQESIATSTVLVYNGPGRASADSSKGMHDNNAPSANYIQSIGLGTFQAGQTLNGVNYDSAFLAFRATSGWWDLTLPLIGVTSYVGNGAGGTRNISVSLGGRAVGWAIVLPQAADFGVIRNSNMASARSMQAGTTVANSITALGTDQITIGSALNVNLRTYSVMVFALGSDLTPPDDPTLEITQTFLEVLTDEDADADAPPGATGCVGGGTVANGVNFTDGGSLATARGLHVWIELTVGATTYRWAKVAINADTRKEPRVLSFGRLVRALTGTTHGFETPSVELELSDYDRVLRGLHNAGSLQNAVGKLYMADAGSQFSGSPSTDPWLLFVGVVRDFRPEGGLRYSLTLEDKLTLAMSAFGQERKLPEFLVDDRISDQNPLEKVHGIPVPLLYGALSDEDEDEPEGTVPCPMINAITLDGHESLGNIYRFLIGKGATADVQAVFRADPDSGDPPTERSKAAASEYGDKLWAPHNTNWIYGSQNYDLIDGASRFSFLYMDQTHPGAELGRQGRIPVAVNCCGYETEGDGTGDTIDSLPLQLLHFLNNFVAQRALTDWLSIASLDGVHSLFDTTSFETVKDVSEDRIPGGYVGAFMIGHSRKQQTLREILAAFCRSGDFDLGVNRHGQLFITMLDRSSTASAAAVFTAESDILEGTFRIDPHADEVENRVRYVYRRRYLETLQQLNPAEGAPGLREPFDAEWISGELTVEDTGAQTTLGQVRESDRLELDMVRDAATATDVAEQRLAKRKTARAVATFAVTCARGMSVELGDIIKVTHFGGIGSSGWTARRLQVRRHEVDLDALTVTITAQDVHDLMA